jgi:3-hydroxymyristoyl/3-hydroxydecanoyl-(acyl carrier protein) dehydratase
MESALPVAADHPAYPGHFPGNPILPGVVVLSEVLAAVAASSGRPPSAWTLANAKFLSPVTPGTALVLRLDSAGEPHDLFAGPVRFVVRAGSRAIAMGTLVARP